MPVVKSKKIQNQKSAFSKINYLADPKTSIDVTYKYLAHLWELYRKSSSVEDVLNKAIEFICTILNAKFGVIYLEDHAVLKDVTIIEDTDQIVPIWEKEFILSSVYKVSKTSYPKNRLPSYFINSADKSKFGESASFFIANANKIFNSLSVLNKYSKVIIIESDALVFCRGIIIFPYDEAINEIFQLELRNIGIYLDSLLPILEVIFWRRIDQITEMLVEISGGIYSKEPGLYFKRIFLDVCAAVQTEGASLFVKGTPSAYSPVQLVATFPKELPRNKLIYSYENYSPTMWLLDKKASCIIPDMIKFRLKLNSLDNIRFKKEPIWCDLYDTKKSQSIMCCSFFGEDDILYHFRCTNSGKNPTNLFHVLDRRLILEILARLSMFHKAVENEYRSVKIFIDIKHELSQKLAGIKSAAEFVRKSLKRNIEEEKIVIERMIKLSHINNTIADISKLLNRFRFPLASIADEKTETKSFLPFNDLVLPICQNYYEKAKTRNISFQYHGKNQIGKVHSNMEEWKEVVENLVNNAVKYTYSGENIQIAFERIIGEGSRIHFASRSLPIDKNEVERIFDISYRTKEAKNMVREGDGMGLSICKFIINRYGGQLLFREENGINIFTITLPRHLFIERKAIE